MNNLSPSWLVFLLMIFLSGETVCQTFTAGDIITLQIQDYSLIDTNHAPVSMVLRTTVAGSPVALVSNSDMFVKVSSIVPGGTKRSVSARITSGVVPPGTRLTLVAAPASTTNSGGALGTVVPTPVILSTTDQNIINLIGSCYTGTGYNDGYRLTYTWFPYSPATDYQLIQATASPVSLVIVLTITAHSGN